MRNISSQLSARRPEERGAAPTPSDLEDLSGQLRGEIRDLARAIKDVQSPLPRILAMTREVREVVTGIQKSQGHTSETLERLEQASQSLALTTDYLVEIAEEDEDEDLDAELAPADEEDAKDAADEATESADGVEDGTHRGRRGWRQPG